MKVVAVKFLDSTTVGEWRNHAAYRQRVAELDLSCEAVGFMPDEYDDRVVVYQSRTTDDTTLSDVLVIPTQAVLSVTELRA